jgi:hypothetical protein
LRFADLPLALGYVSGDRGTLRASNLSDFKTLSEAVAEGEYWIEK